MKRREASHCASSLGQGHEVDYRDSLDNRPREQAMSATMKYSAQPHEIERRALCLCLSRETVDA
jgi:hypothetical protein